MRRREAAPAARSSGNVLYFMELHLRCLYVHDTSGRMRASREPAGRRPPRFHLGRTALGNLWRFRDDLEPSLLRDLSRLAGREAGLPADWSVCGSHPPERLEALRALLRERGGIASEWCGPAYRFPRRIAAVGPEASGCAARLLAIEPADARLLERNFPDAIPDLSKRQPCIAVVEHGHAVSLCRCARSSGVIPDAVEPCGAVEAGIETAPGHRGRGHAARAVAGWARAVRALGLEPLYSTSWQNRPSLRLAGRLGLIAYGEDLEIA